MGADVELVDIAALAPKLPVDNRFSLRFYLRAANNILKQANIYRYENNVVELYVLLLRFSSLVSETIPAHCDYRLSAAAEKSTLRQRLFAILQELEDLKPDVQRHVKRINEERIRSLSFSQASLANDMDLSSQSFNGPFDYSNTSNSRPSSSIIPIKDTRGSWQSLAGNQKNNFSFALPLPKSETLARHSYLGGPFQAKKEKSNAYSRIHYPTHIDTSPIQIASLDQNWHMIPTATTSSTTSAVFPLSYVEPDHKQCAETGDMLLFESGPISSTESSITSPPSSKCSSQFDILSQLMPPPVAAPVQMVETCVNDELPSSLSNVLDLKAESGLQLEDSLSGLRKPRKLHIALKIMDAFMEMAKPNTNRSVETCGVLAGSLKSDIFYVTTLIIPKQEGTSNACQTINEEELFDIQDKHGLFQLGWIHTHPTQSCFMSSIDLHTHYSYQVMLQEAVAIVMAPTDHTKSYGIFRLSDPGGLNTIQQCDKRGFHPHDPPSEGGPIYEDCNHIYLDPSIKPEAIDLR